LPKCNLAWLDYPIGGKFGDGFDTMEFKPFPGYGMPAPGFQLPTPDVDPDIPNQQPPSSDKPGNEQYFLQMRQSIESLNEAMKQIQGMQTPGGQYKPGMATGMTELGSAGK
jgi:hypothetical protein